MMTSTTIWNKLKNEPMQRANPADLVAQGNIVVPPNTGFCYKLGDGQTWGLYFPNGGEIMVGGMFQASKKQPIEVWTEAVQRRGSQLEEKTFGIPGFLVSDTGAKGLQFTLGAKGAVTTQTINTTPMQSGTGSGTIKVPPFSGVAPGDYTAYMKEQGLTDDDDEKEKPKPGRNTAAAKIIAFGNWDVIPDYFAD